MAQRQQLKHAAPPAIELVPAKLLKLDLGCGSNKREDFTGVDNVKMEGVDIVHNLFEFPWPFKDESVAEVHASHFFEHVPQQLRVPMMDEIYRIIVPGQMFNGQAIPNEDGSGKVLFITPYWASPRAYQDPSHQWPPICEASYLYFNKGWKEANKLTHYLGKCDFDFSFAYSMDPETAQRNEESRNFYIKHYLNAISDLHVTLVKRPPEKK